VLSSSVPLTTPGPTNGARADAEEEAEDPLAAQPDEQRTGTDTATGTAVRAAPAAKASHSTGLCRPPATVAATTPTPVPPPRLR
jgi:hypothetical protein